MKATTGCILLAAHALSVTAHPIPPTSDPLHLSLDTPDPLDRVMASLSTLFGYQLAGTASTQDQLHTLCDKSHTLTDPSWQKVAAMGLSPLAVAAPICAASTAAPNAPYALTHSIVVRSDIFATQLANSFDNTRALLTVCHALRIDLLDYFPIDGVRVKDAICHAAGIERPPEPEASPLPPHPIAISAARNTASILFGILLAASATTTTGLHAHCNELPNLMSRLGSEHLDGRLVVQTVCGVDNVIEVDVARQMVAAWMTRWFETVVVNVGGGGSWWRQWLEENLSVQGMDGVGLNGWGVLQEVGRVG